LCVPMTICFQIANSCTRWRYNFKGLSPHGGWVDFSKNLRALLFNDDYRMNLIALHQKFERNISRNETVGLVSNFYIHVAVTDFIFPRSGH